MNAALILLRKPIDDGTCGANQMRRTSPSAASDLAAYFPATILMLFSTDVTPLTACAIETALSAASWVFTVPRNVTTPAPFVLTLMCTRLDNFAAANSLLTLVVSGGGNDMLDAVITPSRLALKCPF